MGPRRRSALGLLLLTVALWLTGCREPERSGIVLRFASTPQGEQMREPFRAALHRFEQDHPGVRVDVIEMDDDVYQQMGLLTLFVGGTPPDVYFQWGGHLVRKYAGAGYALDLSNEFPPAERARFYPSTWASCRGEGGQLYLWPDSASVTTVLWYRKSIFRSAGIAPPATWPELLAACDRLRARGLAPIAVGNRELWAGGNFAAAVMAKYAGVDGYNRILSLQPGTRLNDPSFVQGLTLVDDLRAHGYLNQGVNGVGTDEARSLFSQGRAAIHPIGNWLVSEAPASEVGDYGALPIPDMPGAPGDPDTLLALTTGYMINRSTPHPQECRALLRHLMSDAVQQEWARNGHLSAVRAAAPGAGAPEGQRQLLRLLEKSRATAIAPDVGFDQEVSDAFLDAVSLVLGGRATPAEALAGADRQVRALREAPRR
jgi:ABC-type glycerol-3-phosphate transport system substrate-binding protein